MDPFRNPLQVELKRKKKKEEEVAFQQLVHEDHILFANSQKNDLVLSTLNSNQSIHISPLGPLNSNLSNQNDSVLKVGHNNVTISGDIIINGVLINNVLNEVTQSGIPKTLNGVNSTEGFLFVKNKHPLDSNEEFDAVAYIHDDGVFVGGRLHINLDFPKYDIDVGGDIGCIGNIYLGRNFLENGKMNLTTSMYSWHDHKDTGIYYNEIKEGIEFMNNNHHVMNFTTSNISIDNNVSIGNNLLVHNDLNVNHLTDIQSTGFMFIKSVNHLTFEEMTNDTKIHNIDAVAYIHDDGLFVGGKLHINIDIPKYTLDIGGDIGCTKNIYLGRRNASLSYSKSMYTWEKHPLTGMYNIDTPQENGIGFELDGISKMDILKNEIIIRDEKGQPQSTFESNGDIVIHGDFRSLSDLREKKDIKRMHHCLEKIEHIHGYTYYLKDDIEKKRRIGLLAQEIESVFPEAVKRDENGLLTLSYGNLMSVFVEALHEMHHKLNDVASDLENVKIQLKN